MSPEKMLSSRDEKGTYSKLERDQSRFVGSIVQPNAISAAQTDHGKLPPIKRALEKLGRLYASYR